MQNPLSLPPTEFHNTFKILSREKVPNPKEYIVIRVPSMSVPRDAKASWKLGRFSLGSEI